MGLTYRFSQNAKSRKPNSLTSAFGTLLKNPDLVSVGPGDLHKNLFSIESLTIKLKDGSELVLDSDEMCNVSRYGTAAGYQPFIDKLRRLQLKHHGNVDNILRQADRWSVLPVTGSIDGISKAFEMLLDCEDSYIIEVPAFPPIFDMLEPLTPRAICCSLDKNYGLDPVEIRQKIETSIARGWPVPKLIYTCPTVSNPGGMTTSAQRRREIYQLACEYDFYIIEDDPYFFLKFDDELFKDVPSYLSLDTQGRVLRFDSFSKIISGGFRLGFVTGSVELLNQLTLHIQTSTAHTSQLSQAVVSAMLEKWGDDGFVRLTRSLTDFQRHRMQVMTAAADRHLAGLIDYKKPVGGIFLWFKIKGIANAGHLVLRAAQKGALFVSGSIFVPNFVEEDELPKGSFRNYIRASYSLATEKQIDSAFQIFREAVDEEQIHQS